MCGGTVIGFGLFGKYQLNEWIHLAEGNRRLPPREEPMGPLTPRGRQCKRAGGAEKQFSERKYSGTETLDCPSQRALQPVASLSCGG